ncbi:MAG: hypothetical protein QHC67_17575 [Sphingobium sp.]|uniref:hypothetical protein n=1 Tax=Sphingobium sp. TaxID=1912891 RepID=UPI0029B529FE|nr:hypothetical protein [Sphingobium sp.]MDX3911597.1 hypothetical protein [Sphingobium sp.]
MTGFASFVLRRRSQREQRVIRVIRGCLGDIIAHAEAMAEIAAVGGDDMCQADIARLCALLARARIDIRQPGSAWLSSDELRVLAWVAYAQRETMTPKYSMLGLTIEDDLAAELRTALTMCGRQLMQIGCRLPSLAWTNDIARPLHIHGRRLSKREARSANN